MVIYAFIGATDKVEQSINTFVGINNIQKYVRTTQDQLDYIQPHIYIITGDIDKLKHRYTLFNVDNITDDNVYIISKHWTLIDRVCAVSITIAYFVFIYVLYR